MNISDIMKSPSPYFASKKDDEAPWAGSARIRLLVFLSISAILSVTTDGAGCAKLLKS
jgi:hypothetical protein